MAIFSLHLLTLTYETRTMTRRIVIAKKIWNKITSVLGRSCWYKEVLKNKAFPLLNDTDKWQGNFAARAKKCFSVPRPQQKWTRGEGGYRGCKHDLIKIKTEDLNIKIWNSFEKNFEKFLVANMTSKNLKFFFKALKLMFFY